MPHAIIDSHALVSSPDRLRYPWDPAALPLKAGEADPAMSAERLVRHMAEQRLSGAVLVQRSRFYGFDNAYICDAAASNPRKLKAVCAVDGRDMRCAERARYWLGERGTGGLACKPVQIVFLPRLHEAQPGRAAWHVAADVGAVVQVHFFPWNRAAGMAALMPLLEEFRHTKVIIDNLSNLDPEAPDHGVDDLFRAASDHPQAHTKFTTMLLHRLAARGRDAAPVVQRVVALFGAERVMWGSDLTEATPYPEAVERGVAAARLLNAEARSQVFAGTAASVFGWGP